MNRAGSISDRFHDTREETRVSRATPACEPPPR
jgi:hypothetical protein